jgi:hypothetical protein
MLGFLKITINQLTSSGRTECEDYWYNDESKTDDDDIAFKQLKTALCDSVKRNLFIEKGQRRSEFIVMRLRSQSAVILYSRIPTVDKIPITFASSEFLGAQLSIFAIDRGLCCYGHYKGSELGSLVLIALSFLILVHQLFLYLVPRKAPN